MANKLGVEATNRKARNVKAQPDPTAPIAGIMAAAAAAPSSFLTRLFAAAAAAGDPG